MKKPVFIELIILLFCVSSAGAQQTSWPEITREAKPWTRWWWMGSAVDSSNITYNLEALSRAGIGGVEITPIYGVKGKEAQYTGYLSPEWMKMLAFTESEANRLGMSVDMNNGTGWPFGGPSVSMEDAATKAVFKNDKPEIGKTGQKVKRAAPGGQGYVLDHLNKEAVKRYLAQFDKAFAESKTPFPHSFFNDSYEVYGADWTPALLEEFEKRRGYRLQNYFPELQADGVTDLSARLISDYRETIGDLLRDNFTQVWTDWAHSHGVTTRNQAHGSPANLIDLYALVDIPECESFGITGFDIPGLRKDSIRKQNDSDPMILKFASSAAHITGKKYTSSETLTWLTEHFRTSLSQGKPEIDMMFTSGVNHVFFHGTTYSPQDAPWPGWKFYASVDMSPANTIWRDAPAFFDYIARTQSFLQSGKPDNDFLLYFPIYDIWHEKRGNYYLPFAIHDVLHELPRFAESVETILNSGFDADYISDRFLQTCSVENGLLKTGGGSIYKALILPSVKRIPLETISKIYELAKQGATIIFSGQYPEDVPGLFRLEERRKSFEKIMKHLRTEKTVVTPNIETWPAAFLQPFESEEFITKYNGKLIRRKTDEGHIYFFTMLKNNPVNNWVTLGVNAKSAIFFDPMTGKNGKAKIRQDSGKSEVFMQLKPGQSIILKTFTDKNIDLENWKYFEATGKTFDLNENWNLKFIESKPAVKQTFQLKKTGSWTDLPNDTLKVNMATARYSKSFSFKKEAGKEYLLSLGDVRESAVVRINGKKVATLFAVPFETLIGEYLKDGENLLEIDVTNLPANRIADYDRRGVEWRIFHEINFVDIQYKGTKYDKWEVMPSGLLGEVKIEELSGEQFPLIEKGKPVCIYLSDDQSNVINSAFEMFSEDLAKVSGNKPLKISDLQNNSIVVIHLKTAGNFDKEILKNVDLSEIQNHWEAFSIQQIKYNNKNLLLVAGSDARGTAYGILELSRMIGVSPWVWWADCVPREKTDLYLPENYRNTQKPSVQYRGIFINDEDWGLLPWATKTFDKTAKKGEISPKVYEKVFQLLLRLRANTILPAMHECTVPFYKVEGNAQMADKYGIIVSTSHCEPMLCNIAGEWDKATFGEYNYLINKNFILNYWKKRITETKNYENIYTLGMRGVHDGKMEGVKTLDEQTFVLQQVINDQRQLLQQNLNPNVEQLPQQFVPYKEVLEVYENGLQLPDDVTLTWCDDNYGYIIRLSNENEKKRSGGAGLYYHVSYWGRPHDYLWLCTTPPALLAWQMRKAFDNGARRLWVLNVGDIKPAEYQTELFLDMAWNIESVDVSNVYKHTENFYQREFGADSGTQITGIMKEYYRLATVRKPEFMGWSRVEEYSGTYKNGKTPVVDAEFSNEEIENRLKDYKSIADKANRLNISKPSYFQLVKYPVLAANEMNKKLLYARTTKTGSQQAYDSIVSLTNIYNKIISNAKWDGIMDFKPRDLAVFQPPASFEDNFSRKEKSNPLENKQLIVIKTTDFESKANNPARIINGLGHSGKAVEIAKGKENALKYKIFTTSAGNVVLYTCLLPNHPLNSGDIRFAVAIDDEEPQIVSIKTKFRSEEWKQNVLRNQSIRTTHHNIKTAGEHAVTIYALDEGIVLDQLNLIKI